MSSDKKHVLFASVLLLASFALSELHVAGAARVSSKAALAEHDNRLAHQVPTTTPQPGSARPVVLWHGMGDSCCASYSIGAVKAFLEKKLGVFVHSVATGEGASKDILSSYFGSVNDQVAKVCTELRQIPELKDGFNAIGFSQGGPFIRAVAERCQHTGPKMHTLITMGAPHQGVMNIPGCRMANDTGSFTTCKLMQKLLNEGAYLPYVRDHIVQAQYFKDPRNMDAYLKYNPFLPDINNEHPQKNPLYKQNLASLEKLVLFRFAEDDTVEPRDSAWFSVWDAASNSLLSLEQQDMFREDWIGLKQLKKSGRLVFAEAPGVHMQFTLQWFEEEVLNKYLGGHDQQSLQAA